jgi:hypothetical protein
VEIVPSCFAVSPGYRFGLSVRGKDHEYGGKLDEDEETYVYATRGTGGIDAQRSSRPSRPE